ncbi:MAG TPA: GreA/GreB family elongation factor [Thermoanaerobaculia bacterium]|nr:GreA/GreB family elongation factor [Thermoanaerobaculia bacterium]
MAMQSFLYPKPDNEVFFESFCLKVFSAHLKLPHLQKYGRRGQSQFGIDLLSAQPDGVLGIQCRLKTTSKGLTVEEVDAIIEDARTFTPPLNELVIATTASRDPVLQSHVTRVTQAHKAVGLFGVTISAWEDIEEIFKQNPDLAKEVYAIPAIPTTTTFNVTSFTTINYQMPAGVSHAEIDEAARNLTEGKPDVALALLEKMRRDRWEGLTSRERFRVIANIGNGLLQKGDARGAALAFLEAATHQPQDDDAALSIAAHGHLLSGDAEQAYRMASEACARNPLNERGQIIRIQSAPKEIPYGELRGAVPEVLRANHNIALVLSKRAMEENDPAEAERVLRLVEEESPALHNALGAALLQQGLPASAQEGMLLLPSDPDKVREAHKHLTDAIDSPDAPDDLRANTYFNRGLASLLLKDENQAYADLRSAYEREPNNETFGAALVAEAFRRGENFGALKTAEALFKANAAPRSRLLLSMALYESGTDEAKQRALALLQGGLADLEGIESELRLEYIRRTLHLLSLSGRLTDEAAEALEERLGDPLEKGIIRSLALLRMGRHDEAVVEAQRTAALITEATSFVGKREVALLLSRLELAEQALPLWLEIVPPRTFSEDTVLLLRSAETLGKDGLVLDYCEQLRSNGVYAPEAAENEIELLVRYNELRMAQAVMQEYLDTNPQNISLRLALLNVAVVEGWPEIVDAYTTLLPSPQEIKTVADGARLVQVLQFKGSARAATELAYELVRRFPDEPISHRSLIIAILGIGRSKRDLNLDAPPEVVIGSAVRIRREGEESSQWVVIEDSEKPEISRDEYSPDHPLAKALIGKTVGDTVTLPKLLVRTQTAVIEEIKNKILFRMHQSMEQMNRRFPESSFFEAVSIRVTDESSPPTGHELDELIDLNRQLAQGPMEAENLYRERRMPVAMLSALVHREVPEVVASLALNERDAVHCVEGAAEEFQRVNTVLGPARAVVLDVTALSTIGLLGSDFDLCRMAAACIVSEGTLESLKKLGKSVAEDEGVQGYLRYDKVRERLAMQEIDPEVERERAARAMEFASKIESLCEVVGGRPLARMDPDKRKMLVKIFGPAIAESIAIAKERGCPLWTDDYVTSVLIESELSLQRIWTQPVCFWLRDAASMSADECDIVTARLCGFNYRFTSISWRVIIVACGLCDWNPDKQPLRGVVDRFEEHAREQDMRVFTAGLIPALWREATLIDYASRVTIRVLEKLSHTRKGRATIRAIHQQLDVLFGVNVIGAQNARVVIEAWLEADKRGGSIIES